MELEAATMMLATATMQNLAAQQNRQPRQTPDSQQRSGGVDHFNATLEAMIQQAREEARQQGIADGADAAHTLWRQWLAEMREAQAQGTQFQGATPDGIQYAFLRPGRHSEECARRRDSTRMWIGPDYACMTSVSNYYRDGEPRTGASCPACGTHQPPRGLQRRTEQYCECDAYLMPSGNLLAYFYARRPDLVEDGGAPCVTNHSAESHRTTARETPAAGGQDGRQT